MQSPAAAASPHRLLVRLSGALAALSEGRAEGAALVSEEELLGRPRKSGLITYPSPLLGRLLERLPEVIAAEVLPRLDPADRAVVAQVGRPWLAAVVSSGLTRGGKRAGVPLKITHLVGPPGGWLGRRRTGARGSPGTCAIAGSPLGTGAALRWAREHESTCAHAAGGGLAPGDANVDARERLPVELNEPVCRAHGQWCSRAHCSASSCPYLAAIAQRGLNGPRAPVRLWAQAISWTDPTHSCKLSGRFEGLLTQAGRRIGRSALSTETRNQNLATQTPFFL
jgi:hypothetical protein